MKNCKFLIYLFIIISVFIFKFGNVEAICYQVIDKNGVTRYMTDVDNNAASYTIVNDKICENLNNVVNYDEGNIVSCGPDLIKDIPSLIPSTIHIIYLILQLAVPILLVVLGSIDFVKSLTSQKDDEIKKGQKTFISRIIAGVIVFFVFSIVKLIVSLVADSDNSAKIINCVDCFISNNEKCIR